MNKMTPYNFLIIIILLLAGQFQLTPLFAKSCHIEIIATKKMTYNLSKIEIPKQCASFKIKLTNKTNFKKNIMGHNLIVSLTKSMKKIVQESASSGLKNDYIPADRTNILAFTKLLSGGESDTISIEMAKIDKNKEYSFYCTFPGHYTLMKGSLVFEK